MRRPPGETEMLEACITLGYLAARTSRVPCVGLTRVVEETCWQPTLNDAPAVPGDLGQGTAERGVGHSAAVRPLPSLTWKPIHQQPPQTPLFALTNRANAGHVPAASRRTT